MTGMNGTTTANCLVCRRLVTGNSSPSVTTSDERSCVQVAILSELTGHPKVCRTGRVGRAYGDTSRPRGTDHMTD
jgi:hypothetical protein